MCVGLCAWVLGLIFGQKNDTILITMQVCRKHKEFKPGNPGFQAELARQTALKILGKDYYCPVASLYLEKVDLLNKKAGDEVLKDCCSVCDIHFADMNDPEYQKAVRGGLKNDGLG